jgi:hypothetical protein
LKGRDFSRAKISQKSGLKGRDFSRAENSQQNQGL